MKDFSYPIGATPLDPDEANGLIPAHIQTQSQLNEWEQANIVQAERWATSKRNRIDLLTIDFVKLLHEKMFDKTWKWAGNFRPTQKNIGVEASSITTNLHNLFENVRYQIEHNIYSEDEIAYRFHHLLVFIHPFSNGNGRHSRMMTDLLLVQLGKSRFSWGSINLVDESETRQNYIKALRDADKHDYKALAEFVRS